MYSSPFVACHAPFTLKKHGQHILSKIQFSFLSVIFLALVFSLVSRAAVISTSGEGFDLTSNATWAEGVVPGASDTASFTKAGVYVGTNGAVLNWGGINFATTGVELSPTTPVSINLGAGGIIGSSARLGLTQSNLLINVGSTTQTWTAMQGNVSARISGNTDAVINLNGNGVQWHRGDNSAFQGTWRLNTAGSVLKSSLTNALGGVAARVDMGNGTSIRFNAGNASGHIQVANFIIRGNATFTVDSGVNLTLLGRISSATTGGPATLTVAPSNGSLNTLNFAGNHTDFVGSMVFNPSNTAGFHVYFQKDNLQSFALGANRFVDGADTTTNALIRAVSGTKSTALIFNGGFIIDTSLASTTAGNTWKLIDQEGLAVSYGSTFFIQGFVVDTDGVTWQRPENGRTWTYSETTGLLTVSEGGTALPAPPPRDIFFMGGQSNAKFDVALGIQDVLTKSGQFNNPDVVWINHPGKQLMNWSDNQVAGLPVQFPREFYDSDLFGLTGTYNKDFLPQGKLQKALSGYGGPHKFRGFFWWQGESDQMNGTSFAYAARFLGMMNQLAADTGQSIGTGPEQWTYHIALPDDVARSFETIRRAQIAMIDANPTQGTYFDTRPYPRLAGDTNPHVSPDLDYFIGVEMARQLLAFRGLPPVDLTAPNQTLVKTAADSYTRKLSRYSGWMPAAVPGPTNILLFNGNLSTPVVYDIGGSPDFGNLKIRGLWHNAPVQITINYDAAWGLTIGEGGLAVEGGNLVLGSSIVTSASQTWTVASGRSLICNNANAVLDLRNASLTGAGTYDLRAGTYDFGSSVSTGTLSFSGGGQTVKFSTASTGGAPGPLGVATDLRSGVGANAIFQFTGVGSAAWNRNLLFDTAASPGRSATFEITSPGATFSSSGIIGVSASSTSNILNLKVGGAGNLEFTGSGGIKTTGSAVCNLEKTGTGTLTLSGNGNTFNGPLSITAGKVIIAATSGVNTSPTITVGSANTAAVFDYQGTMGLSSNVTVGSGSTFIYNGGSAMTGQITADNGSIVILDGALSIPTLTIPANGRLILRGNATLPANLTLVNNGTLDTSTWLGTLPPDFTNNGTLLAREDIRTSDFTSDSNGQYSLKIQGRLGHSYQLQTSTTLQVNDWVKVGRPVEGTENTITFNYTLAVPVQKIFFRVLVQP
jgi:autotransporter-associated beta strand protein